jgi:hypothetical protein
MRATMFAAVAAAAVQLLPVMAAAQQPNNPTVVLRIVGNSIDATPSVVTFGPRVGGKITWQLPADGDWEFDDDGGRSSIDFYEVAHPTATPDRANRGKGLREFDQCKVVGGNNKRRYECRNRNTEPGTYKYDIRLKHRDGTRKVYDPVIINL